MTDSEGVLFLQWCLPLLGMRWSGFRKVRRQVCKRINRRMEELRISDLAGYRSYLERYPEEWQHLDTLCRISISRFYRDKGVYQYLVGEVLPELARLALAGGERDLRGWSVGCASGEEPYSVAIIWKLALEHRFPTLGFRILATDADPHALTRAERACYPASSLKDLPEGWLEKVFQPGAGDFTLRDEYRKPVTFRKEDTRVVVPNDRFHFILCRNFAFTYFDNDMQRDTLQKITTRLRPRGALVIGGTESLPEGPTQLEPWSKKFGVYRRSVDPPPQADAVNS